MSTVWRNEGHADATNLLYTTFSEKDLNYFIVLGFLPHQVALVKKLEVNVDEGSEY